MRDFVLQILFGLIIVAILIWCAFTFKGNHGGPGNYIAAFTMAFFPLIDAFAPLSDAVTETNVYSDSINRLNDLPTPLDQSNNVDKLNDLPKNYTIDVEKLSYHFEREVDVLKNLSLHVETGEKVAILGKSGSGKSTLAKLLRGDLIPSTGTIEIGGKDVRALNPDIHKLVGVIQQEPYLFNTTILNNLRIGDESATVERGWEVLDSVGLKEMVERLPDGIYTMVDEAGLRFSGGERHRLSLARVLLQDVSIVILDEPTVGLDPITENQLLDSFFKALEGKTLIWITHHLLGVDRMDRVLFIEDGTLELDGTPEALSETSTRYQILLNLDKGF
jgi:ATP-binding cassette subfamily C protein CydC